MKIENLILARKYLGLNQKKFAELLNVSQATISQIEAGFKPITQEMVDALTPSLGEKFFYQKPSNPNLKVHYRVSSTIAKGILNSFEARIELMSNNINTLLETVDIPEYQIPQLDPEDYEMDAKYIANEIRSYLGLGRKPVGNLIALLEKQGVIIHYYDFDFISEQNKTLDGVSFFMNGVPIILINKKIQNARKYFTIAHELGHIIMHLPERFIIAKQRDIEKEANEFASELLIPSEAIREDLININPDKLLMLKHKWRVSASALLYKAKDLTLTKDQYRRWIQKMSMMGWRKNEPMDIEIEKPSLLKTMLDVCSNEMGGKAELTNELGINPILFDELYGGYYEERKAKLRILI